ncbi:MAG: tRNA guanosine(34) transglycosylase Tgt [Elusimicrobia bacterium]|nr:tRNA guanosine(34) transglycosylase Tgt [Elusimicrobiota bacterium]MBD3412172.1 tRNA guanosine(34) transglycosylase Tgt [Elusimicrobiota bacterium]
MFTITKKSNRHKARLGRLDTSRGSIETPVFMPVGTQASVKALSTEELEQLNVPIILANAYHLYIRPGTEIISNAGGLHGFMHWDKPILTDSGGYQVFSLADLRKVTDEGVAFQSHVDGAPIFFTPELVVDIQRSLGSDIGMVLDECPAYPCEKDHARVAVERTYSWARASQEHWKKKQSEFSLKQMLFGIIQGSTFPDLRAVSCRQILSCEFPGYAIGGVSVGEPKELMHEAVNAVIGELPDEYPRYLMGVGMPEDIWEFIEEGVDMFDCVVPTRNARKGQVFTFSGKFNVMNSPFKHDYQPIDPACRCPVCSTGYSRAYINHLFRAQELLAPRLTSLHNVYFMIKLLELIKTSIKQDTFEQEKKRFLHQWNQK